MRYTAHWRAKPNGAQNTAPLAGRVVARGAVFFGVMKVTYICRGANKKSVAYYILFLFYLFLFPPDFFIAFFRVS
jgi:hypothetical protein